MSRIRIFIISVFCTVTAISFAACASAKPPKTYDQLYQEAGQRDQVVTLAPTEAEDDSDIASEQAQYVRMENVEPTGEIRLYTGGSRERIAGVIDPETGMPIAADAGVDEAGGEPAVVASLPPSGSFEITSDDIAGNRAATSANITVLGLRLGDSKAGALKKVGALGKYDERTRTFAGSGLLIKFDKKDRIISIGMNAEFKDRLQGKTGDIVDARVFTDETYRQRRIAPEDGIVEGQVTLPGGHTFKTITYQFFARGMEVTGTRSDDGFTFNYFTLVPVRED